MARGNQIIKAVRTHGFLCALLLGAVTLFITGCLSGVKELCSLEERVPVMEDGLSRTVRYADGFISDLCVAGDEYSFDESYVTSEAAALFGISGREILYSKEVLERLYPASITKVMTALVAIENGDLNARVVVTDDAVITEPGAILCGIKSGDTLTLEQLLYGLMLPSGSDAGAAIAMHIAGSIDKLVDMTNREAASLGITGTHFVNPHGLNDPDHYTTAYDLYLIFDEALKYPVFWQIVGTTSYTVNYHDKDSQAVTKTWKGGNWFITQERGTPEGLTVFDGKAGIINAAGYCLIAATRDRDDKEYISVILKSDSRPGLYDNMTNIISRIVR